MDPILNPYMPGSGIRPPAMVGRDVEISAMRVAIQRTERGMQTRSMCLWGLRGVGKTVLLNAMRAQASTAKWLAVGFEAAPSQIGQEPTKQRFARELVTAAREMKIRSQGTLKESLKSITSLSLSVGLTGVSLGVERTTGRADTGRIDLDLEETTADICRDLRGTGKGFAIFIDEMQDLDSDFIAALLTTQHKANQEQWPFFAIGAGLPNLPARLSSVRSYAERLFEYQEIGPLTDEEARDALTSPAKQQDIEFTPQAVNLLIKSSNGYPYFLQEFGKAIWSIADSSPFTLDDAQKAIQLGTAALDDGFFPARWMRTTPTERSYLSAMSQDGDTGSSSSEIANRLGKTTQSLGPTRSQLMSKGLIYSPEHNIIKFSVPGMASFIARQNL